MSKGYSRRDFIAALGTAAASSCLTAVANLPAEARGASSPIQFGYAAISWGGNDRQAIVDIASLGYPAVQLRSNVLTEFPDNTVATVKDLLTQNKIQMVAFSSGDLNIDKPEADQYDLHAGHAKFVHDLGGLYLQVIASRPKDRAITSDDYAKCGRMLTELGKRTADVGVSLGLHNHMSSLAQGPDEVDKIFDTVDTHYAKLELDIAHAYQGNCDPVKMIHEYHDRLLFLHLKDVIEIPPGVRGGTKYKWVELGKGLVDVPGVMAALKKNKFRGWAVIELDNPPEAGDSPKGCAEDNKKYIQEKLGYKI
jgi:inosose dehydratase